MLLDQASSVYCVAHIKQEERDILVDKLLATTEALHASEARNRESQASASQVGACLLMCVHLCAHVSIS